jgi:hypothetical protein
MQFLNAIAALSLCLAAVVSCKTDNGSKVKEFEFSSNICQDIQNATDKRWTEASGQTKEQYHAALISQEKQIIAYELPRYQQRLSDIQSNTGPANGPTAQVQPLTNAPAKTTPDNPSAAVPPTSTNNGVDENTPTPDQNPADQASGFDLQGNASPNTDALAKEVCPGCTLEQVEAKIRVLQQNQNNLPSCVMTGAEPQTAGTEDEVTAGLTPEQKIDRSKDIEQIKNLVLGASNAKGLCDWWGTISSGTGASRDRCQRETIKAFCSAALKAAGNVVADVINEKSDEKIAADIEKTIPGAIKSAITGCIQQMAYDTVKSALRNAGTREFLPAATKKLAQEAIKSDVLSDAAKAEKAAKLKKEIALLVCSAGTKLIANQIDEQPQVNYDNPCRAIFATSKSRAKACLNTTSSICKIGAGDIKLENFLPEDAISEKPTAALLTEAANVIAQAGCKSAGNVQIGTVSVGGATLCATISEAADQIRKALTTGNNDWAHCLGTDQAGACTGTVVTEYMLGVKIADFKEPVRVPAASTEAPGYQETEVCWCYYSCYQDDWGTDTELTRSNFYTVISRGEAGQRECRNVDGRWNWTGQKSKAGYHLYWKKNDCGIYPARSNATQGFASAGGFELNVGGKWVYKNITSQSGSCPSGI